MPQCLLHSYQKHWLNDCVDDLTPIQHQTKLIINQLTPNFATWRPKSYLFTQIDLLHIWPKQAVTMAAQAKFLLQPSNTPFSCYQCHFPPTFIILPAYIQYDSVLAYQRGPVRSCMCIVQQSVFNRYHCPGYLILQWEWSSAPICSHLPLLHFNYTVLIGFASMLWSQRVLPGKQSTVTEYSDPDFLIGLNLMSDKQWLTLKTTSYASLINSKNAKNVSFSFRVRYSIYCTVFREVISQPF